MNDDYYDYIEKLRNEERRQNQLHEELLRQQKQLLLKNALFNKIQRIIIPVILMIVLIIVLLTLILKFILKKDIFFFKDLNLPNITLVATTFFIGIGFILMKYLQSNDYSKKDSFIKEIYLNELSELKYSIEVLKNKSGKGKETEININNIVEEAIQNKFSDRFIQQRIEENYKNEAIKDKKIKNLIYSIENKSNRLDDEILRLRKSANINLVIGTLSTFLSIFCLVYEVFYNEVSFTNTTQILSHYIPRISLVIFIEIFAFFFLKLYKSNLFEIKYFNNEKTNIDFKVFSLKTAIHYEDTEMIKSCISNFIETERNFIIKKDESTIDLEKHKYDNLSNTDLKDMLLGILKTNSK